MSPPSGRRPDGVRKTVLIVDGDAGASLSVARSLGRRGWRVLVQAGTRTARSRYVAAAVGIPDSSTDAAGFAAAVARVCTEQEVDVVSPASDSSVELLWQTPLPAQTRMLGGDRRSAALALDKVETLRAAAAAGFPTPRFVAAPTVRDASVATSELGYPCVVKARRSFAVDGMRRQQWRHTIVWTLEDARRTVERYAAATDLVPIVEEWVQGRNLAVAAVVRSGRVLAWGAREASSQFPMIGGIAVRRRTIGGDEPGVEAALELLRALEFEGLGDVQYVASHDSGPRLMEVGARPYGWLPLTIAAGADLPHIAVDAMDGVEPDEVVVAKAGLEMLWPGGELRRLASLVRPSTPLPPYSSRVRGLTQAWPPWRRGLLYDGYERDDLRPLFGRFSSGRGSHDAPHRLRHVRRAHEALVNAGQRP